MSFIMAPNRQVVYNKTEFYLTKSVLSLIRIKLVFGTLSPSGPAEVNTFENSMSFVNFYLISRNYMFPTG